MLQLQPILPIPSGNRPHSPSSCRQTHSFLIASRSAIENYIQSLSVLWGYMSSNAEIYRTAIHQPRCPVPVEISRSKGSPLFPLRKQSPYFAVMRPPAHSSVSSRTTFIYPSRQVNSPAELAVFLAAAPLRHEKIVKDSSLTLSSHQGEVSEGSRGRLRGASWDVP